MERAELGIEGNCGFALLGKDLQVGEAEFVEMRGLEDVLLDQLEASKKAFRKLKTRLGRDDLSYYFGPSHPYGS